MFRGRSRTAGGHRRTEASDRIRRGVTAVLVRPDARIAWAATDTDPQRRAADCRTALRTLCR
ncbi:hypothetical protein [Streptomyces sp. LamerLS-31b]|uniref:aromatic-ring hydroxylase C-terminal domain-containing protein n=1 Tax=Streptomyces sp. LamerLS-31b TaxID=1839765 RepID=UPI0031F2EC8C